MIYSLIFRVAARLLVPLLLLFSLFMLIRGHSYPGGGFVGGLVAGSAFVLYALAASVKEARALLGTDPQLLLGTGLACAAGAGLIGLASGTNFMTSLWLKIPIPGLGYLKLGTTLLFDIGVMLVVVGTVLLMVFSIEDRLPGLVED